MNKSIKEIFETLTSIKEDESAYKMAQYFLNAELSQKIVVEIKAFIIAYERNR